MFGGWFLFGAGAIGGFVFDRDPMAVTNMWIASAVMFLIAGAIEDE